MEITLHKIWSRFNRLSGPSLLAVGLLFATQAHAQLDYATPYTFITIAGTFGNAGNVDGTNGAAEFYAPYGVAVATNDTLYVVDNAENTVRQVVPVGTNWMVTTIAGTAGVPGNADGTNQGVAFSGPTSIALDATGNLYVADGDNNTVRELSPSGTNWISSTIAGSAIASGSQDGTNGVALFDYPSGVTVDAAGRLYVADANNNTIREVVPSGTNWVVTTIAGTAGSSGKNDGTNGAAQFNYPAGIAVDRSGNIFVADTGNYTIRKLTPQGTNWVVTTIAGTAGNFGSVDGTNGAAQFFSPIYIVPMSLAVDTNDNVYVADGGNGLIRKVTPIGTNWVTTTLAGSITAPISGNEGTGTNAVFGTPSAVAVDAAGRLFMGDSGSNDLWEGTAANVWSLAVAYTGFNKMQLSWLSGGSSVLETNSNLSSTNWGVYGGTLSSANGTNSVMVSTTNRNLFFRLGN
jgi:sugar lactone lactonase YvrE